jgi:hypothetical protein
MHTTSRYTLDVKGVSEYLCQDRRLSTQPAKKEPPTSSRLRKAVSRKKKSGAKQKRQPKAKSGNSSNTNTRSNTNINNADSRDSVNWISCANSLVVSEGSSDIIWSEPELAEGAREVVAKAEVRALAVLLLEDLYTKTRKTCFPANEADFFKVEENVIQNLY